MDALIARRHSILLNKLNDLLPFVFEDDKELIKKIISKSKNIVYDYNSKKLTVLDASIKEDGLFRSNVKKIVAGRYYNPISKSMRLTLDDIYNYDFICEEHRVYDEKYKEYNGLGWVYYDEDLCESCKHKVDEIESKVDNIYNEIECIRKEFNEACDRTIIDDELRNQYILFRRTYSWTTKLSPLQSALLESIYTGIFIAFQKQNKKLITKYI